MPRRSNVSKLSPQEHQKLIQIYKISFEGPIRPCEWPSRYSNIFHKVRDAEKIRYEEYLSNPGNDPRKVRQIAELCKLTEDLVRKAYQCRNPAINESTWRGATEHLILHRFEAEIKCHICNSWRWISDLQAIPTCPTAARRLQEERSQRSLCLCEERIRAKLQPTAYAESIFSIRKDCPVVDKTLPEIQTKVLKQQRPDLVIGLATTNELVELVSAHQGLETTTTKDDDKIIFPFLLLEAKAEERSPGFDSVERQSAFPIKALIDLQQGLERQTGVAFDPFVWFLANQGDEWRVYGCFTDRGSIRVVDLWHGCILRHDSALQLFLIMDLICDWAREIYWNQIRRCLSGGHDSLAGQATAGLARESSCTTDIEYLASPRSEQGGLHAGVSPTQSSSAVSNDIAIKEESQGDTTMVDNEIPSLESILSMPIPLDDRPQHWSSNAVFRHANCIRLRFRHFAIPDTFEGLEAIFKGQTAKMLLYLFRLHDPLIVSWEFISRVRKAWILQTVDSYEEDNNEYETDDMSEANILAVLAFRTFFDYAEWSIIQELSFITASCATINTLVAFVTGSARPVPFVREDWMRKSWIRPQIIQPLRYLPIAELIKAAAMDLCLHFQVSRGVAAPTCWIPDRMTGMKLHRIWSAIDAIWEPFAYACLGIYQDCPIKRATERPFNIPLPFLKVPDCHKTGHVAWVKKPDSIATTGPEYCIFFFDMMLSNADHAAIGRRIMDLLSQSAIPWYNSSGTQLIRQHDIAVLTHWADMLTGKKPADSPWPTLD